MGKLILRREFFGGVMINTSRGGVTFLTRQQYACHLQKLKRLRQEIPEDIMLLDARDKGYPLLKDAVATPMYLFIELTKRCNGYCQNCYMNADNNHLPVNELSLDEIRSLIDSFSDYGGYYMRLTGGEPTQHPNIIEILEFIKKKKLYTSINTNGSIKDELLFEILSNNINEIRISIDGPERINDTLRWKGAFVNALRTLKKLAKYNARSTNPVKLIINVVLMKANLQCIPEMIAIGKKAGAVVSFGLLRLTGRAQVAEMLNPEEVFKAVRLADDTRRKFHLPASRVRINFNVFNKAESNFYNIQKEFRPYPFDNSKCPMGTGGIFVDSQGATTGCGYLLYADRTKWSTGNIREKSIMSIWQNSRIFQKLRQLNRPSCKSCEFHKIRCNGGCPVMAYVVNGDLDGKDPYCVRNVANIGVYHG